MIASFFVRRSLLPLLLALGAAGVFAQAQPAPKPFEPQVGQEGKDVIWVPTPQALVDKMLDIAKVTSRDYVIDLGSGDGRTVITMYLLPQLNLKLRPIILDLKPGTRIVSHAFTMEEWTADQTESVDGRTSYLWIVPAKVEGTWRLAQGELALRQSFQTVAGTLKTSGNTLTIANGKLRGDQISFSAGSAEYTGRVNGDTIQGTVKGGSSGSWTATRVGASFAAAPAKY